MTDDKSSLSATDSKELAAVPLTGLTPKTTKVVTLKYGSGEGANSVRTWVSTNAEYSTSQKGLTRILLRASTPVITIDGDSCCCDADSDDSLSTSPRDVLSAHIVLNVPRSAVSTAKLRTYNHLALQAVVQALGSLVAATIPEYIPTVSESADMRLFKTAVIHNLANSDIPGWGAAKDLEQVLTVAMESELKAKLVSYKNELASGDDSATTWSTDQKGNIIIVDATPSDPVDGLLSNLALGVDPLPENQAYGHWTGKGGLVRPNPAVDLDREIELATAIGSLS